MDNVLLWDENKVNKWIASIGYPSLETQFKEQGITGDVLVNLDHDTLKDLSIHAVGQRMDILKHIYHLKTSHRIPVNEWDYIPPSVLYENDYLGPNGMADYRKIEAAFQERDIHLKKLTEDLVRLSTDMNRMREDMMHLWKNTKDKKPLPSFENDKSPPFKNYGSHKPLHSLTPPTTSSHSTDYFYGSYDNNNNRRPIGSETTLYTDEAKLVPSVTINDGGAIKVYGEKISNNSKVELEASKNVRLLSDDTCSKVITAALKKYNVVDDWRQYSLWIQYGPHDNIQERLLSYDEKPLRISQKLKEAKLNPVYILKHVKDNKPFIPELQKSTDANNMYNNNNNNNNNSNSSNANTNNNNNNNNNSRSIPKSSYDNTTTTNNNNNNNNHSNYWKHSNEKSDQLPKTAIISGRVGYDVVAPVMSSSVSSPTPSTIQQRNNKSNNNNDHKTNQDTINNTNNNSNNNSNSNNSNNSNNNNNNNNNNNSNIKINDSDKILEKEESKDNANATNSTILSQKPTDQFLTDLGLESANAIMYSLMMEQDSDKPL